MREQYKGYTIRIESDDFAPDPRMEFDFFSQDDVDAWNNGDVYGYVIEDHDGYVIDSCWGFYGDYEYCLDEARTQATFFALERDNKHALALVAGF